MTDARRGILAMIASCTVWGLSGLYYKAINHVPPVEVVLHRMVWAMVFFGLILMYQGRLRAVLAELRSRRTLGVLTLSALMISINWFGFILAVHNGWALDASFGYYIFPLMAVLIGTLLLGERLEKLQILAVTIAGFAVVMLAFGLGVTPWISLLLATTFSIYGVIKRGVEMGPVASVFLEALIFAPLTVAGLMYLHATGQGHFGQDSFTTSMLLFSGPLTAVPLLLFSYATRRVNFATIGILQFINPTLQLCVAVLIFSEPFTGWHQSALILIWIALTLYSISSFRSRGRTSKTPHPAPK